MFFGNTTIYSTNKLMAILPKLSTMATTKDLIGPSYAHQWVEVVGPIGELLHVLKHVVVHVLMFYAK
jgi:hypothetical protein